MTRPSGSSAPRRRRGPKPWPPVSDVRWDDTHRLIPAVYADTDEPLLADLAEQESDIPDLVALAAATNPRLQAQANVLPGGIHQDELLFGVPHWRIVNAAFCHPHPLGSRFNGPDRGAWYAGREVRTSLAEVAHHRTVELAEIDWWELEAEYQDYLADIHAPLHDLRGPRDRRARACLDPDSYVESQALAATLLGAGSVGVAYPAVRDPGGEAVACFRPAAVGNVRTGHRFTLTWSGAREPAVTEASRPSG
jgi:hypothetical protein